MRFAALQVTRFARHARRSPSAATHVRLSAASPHSPCEVSTERVDPAPELLAGHWFGIGSSIPNFREQVLFDDHLRPGQGWTANGNVSHSACRLGMTSNIATSALSSSSARGGIQEAVCCHRTADMGSFADRQQYSRRGLSGHQRHDLSSDSCRPRVGRSLAEKRMAAPAETGYPRAARPSGDDALRSDRFSDIHFF